MKFLFFFFLFSNALAQTVTPDRIFHGGSVITLNDAGYIGEAIAIADGKVLRVGTNQEIMKLKSKNTQMHDLQGKSLLPGLIDAHGHIGAHLSFWKKPNLAPPPAGPVSQISDIIKIMQEEIAKNRPSENALVLGMNYDDSLLKEKRHPTRQEVDLLFRDIWRLVTARPSIKPATKKILLIQLVESFRKTQRVVSQQDC